MTFKTRLTSAIATGAVLLNALAPVALAQDVTVTNNAAGSVNEVNTTNTSTTTAAQTNNAVVTNVVTSNSNTGNNTASFNSGGDTAIGTGAATSGVSVENAVNKNVASFDCDCIGDGVDVTISDNAALSQNTANVLNANTTTLGQTNNAVVTNVVTANSNSGGNTASFNHGGNSTIGTGAATSAVAVSNAANANLASFGGSAVPSDDTSVLITNNAGLSVNTVNLTQASALAIGQTNNAFVTNLVTANANTGNNTASFNSGGDTAIGTGPALTHVVVDNLLNFNAVSLDCDCVLGGLGLLKIGSNAALSVNTINALNANLAVFAQGNNALATNVVTDNSNSGGNTASFNQGPSGSDPAIGTGAASSLAAVSTSANANLLGNVDVDFNVLALWAVLWGWVA